LVILAAMPTSLHEGDDALIINGPFAGKLGTITRIDSDSATVVCDVFDRDTPVEVDLSDLQQP
jgi:transcription antitermination factor NusG